MDVHGAKYILCGDAVNIAGGGGHVEQTDPFPIRGWYSRGGGHVERAEHHGRGLQRGGRELFEPCSHSALLAFKIPGIVPEIR